MINMSTKNSQAIHHSQVVLLFHEDPGGAMHAHNHYVLMTMSYDSMARLLTVVPFIPLSPFSPICPGGPGLPGIPSEPCNPAVPGEPCLPFVPGSPCY